MRFHPKVLPAHPNLNFLRREAKALKSRHRNRDLSVCSAIGHFDISLHNLSAEELFDSRFSILDAQRVVARRYGFSSWRRLKLFVDKCSSINTIDQPLRDKLLNRDREIKAFIDEVKGGNFKEHHRPTYNELHEKATELMNPIFDEYGWPGPELVGRDGADACYMIVGHAVEDRSLNKRACELLKAALPEANTFGYYYANLKDRYLTLSNEPCIYGTSAGIDDEGRVLFTTHIVDRDSLDKRRATVGCHRFALQQEETIQALSEAGEDIYSGQQRFIEYQQNLAMRGGYI